MENNLNKYKEFKLTLEVQEHDIIKNQSYTEYQKQSTLLATQDNFKDLINNKTYLLNTLNSMILTLFEDYTYTVDNQMKREIHDETNY